MLMVSLKVSFFFVSRPHQTIYGSTEINTLASLLSTAMYCLVSACLVHWRFLSQNKEKATDVRYLKKDRKKDKPKRIKGDNTNNNKKPKEDTNQEKKPKDKS